MKSRYVLELFLLFHFPIEQNWDKRNEIIICHAKGIDEPIPDNFRRKKNSFFERTKKSYCQNGGGISHFSSLSNFFSFSEFGHSIWFLVLDSLFSLLCFLKEKISDRILQKQLHLSYFCTKHRYNILSSPMTHGFYNCDLT